MKKCNILDIVKEKMNDNTIKNIVDELNNDIFGVVNKKNKDEIESFINEFSNIINNIHLCFENI